MKRPMLRRTLSYIANISLKHRLAVLGIAFGLTVVSLVLASRLRFSGDMTDFLPRNSEDVEQLRDTLSAFSMADDLYILVEKKDSDIADGHLTSFADAIGEALQASGEFHSVTWKLPPSARDYVEQIMFPHLPLFLDDGAFEAFAERLTPEAIEIRLKRNMHRLRAGSLGASHIAITRDPLGLGELLLPALESQRGSLSLDTSTGYVMSPNHEALIIAARGRKRAQNTEYSLHVLETADRIIEKLRTESEMPGASEISCSYAGGYPVAAEGQATMKHDLTVTSSFSTAAVLVLFFIAFRNFRAIHFVGLPLVMGLCWTLGFAAVVVGHLNIVSVVFAAMIAGLAIDFPIHLYNRFRIERGFGAEVDEALRSALTDTGVGIVTAALTTFVALSMIVLSRPAAFQDLGVIAGTGILLCLVAMLFVVPALISLFPGPVPKTSKAVDTRSTNKRSNSAARWIAVISILISGAAIALVAGSGEPGVAFERDLGKLRIMDEATLPVQQRIQKHFGGTFDPLLVVTPGETDDEALESAWRVDQEIRQHLGTDRALANVQGLFPWLVPSSIQMFRIGSLRELNGPEIASHFRRAAVEAGFKISSEYEDYAKWIGRICSLDRPLEFSADLHPFVKDLRNRFISHSDGRHLALTIVNPRERLWVREVRDQVFGDLRQSIESADPPSWITGFTSILSDLEDTVKADILLCTTAAFIVIVMILIIQFRNTRLVLLALVPVILGLLWTLGIMKALDLRLNHVNIMLFILAIGIGVDDGIHLVHRLMRTPKDPIRGTREVAPAIILTTLTTLLGFGSLFFARHLLIHSLGIVVILALTCILITSLLVLPALWILTQPKEQG